MVTILFLLLLGLFIDFGKLLGLFIAFVFIVIVILIIVQEDKKRRSERNRLRKGKLSE